ncbi:MAG: hypothetical protein WCA22_11820, partial [Candidatus Binatus sp.]
NQLLSGVIAYGTGRAATIGRPEAGKTGTTQDYRDAYFIGYTPAIVCGVWVGFDEPESLGLTGAQAALPAWVQFMEDAAPADAEDFPEPSGITMATIDPESGGLATSACPLQVALPFLLGTAPTQMCPLHGGIFASAPASAPVSATMPPAPPSAAPQPVASASPSSSDVFGAVGKFFKGIFSH